MKPLDKILKDLDEVVERDDIPDDVKLVVLKARDFMKWNLKYRICQIPPSSSEDD